MEITFASCFYVLKSKFDATDYQQWMQNLISIVNHFNLVIFTDDQSISYLPSIASNQRIKIIKKSKKEWQTFEYKNNWIENHNKNSLLNQSTCWELNALWSEKINFVKEVADKKYFDTEFYGWCDIGYFRNRDIDTNTVLLSEWASPRIINTLDKSKVYYALVHNNYDYINMLVDAVNNNVELPHNQVSIAGGFFLLHNSLIDWWHNTYYNMLTEFFRKHWLVKDDQLIIVYCVFKNIDRFIITSDSVNYKDTWFMFQRLLQ
jgi:hypothetical protein